MSKTILGTDIVRELGDLNGMRVHNNTLLDAICMCIFTVDDRCRAYRCCDCDIEPENGGDWIKELKKRDIVLMDDLKK